MTPVEYMLLPLRRYAQFNGRANRAEYWWFVLMQIIFTIVCVVGMMLPIIGVVFALALIVASVGFIVPGLAVSFRRMHDIDRSAAWLLILFVPVVGTIALLIFVCLPGTSGPNRFGDGPKAPLDEVVEAF